MHKYKRRYSSMIGTDKLGGSQIQANVYSKIVDINHRDRNKIKQISCIAFKDVIITNDFSLKYVSRLHVP